MTEKGFYVAMKEEPVFGLGVALVYMKEEKDLQFSITFLDMTMAIGYVF